MNAKEVIETIKLLPESEKREVARYLQEIEVKMTEASATGKRMSFKEAMDHVFASYDDVLRKLAQ